MATLKRRVAYGSVEVGPGITEPMGHAYGSVEISFIDGLLIMADILDANIAGAGGGSYAHTEINAELLVNSVELPITQFNFQAPTGRLGALLNVTLATKDPTAVPNGATIDFNLIVNGNTYKLIEDGKLQGRSVEISFQGGSKAKPTDEITFSSIDVLADKFTLAPERPVIMYDPYRVRYDEVNDKDITGAMRNEDGSIIRPILEPVAGLTMKQIMKRAYTDAGGLGFMTAFSGLSSGAMLLLGSGATNQTGMGFDDVITNIPDYKVKRADFTIEGGWHDGVRPSTEMYAPVYFVQDNKLYILDVEQKIPFSSSVHTLTLGDHKRLTEATDYQADRNAVILTYQYSANDPSEDAQKTSREVFNEYIEESGVRGTDGWTKIVERRWDKEYYMPSEPDNVLDTVPLKVDVYTYKTVAYNIYNDVTGIETRVVLQDERLVHRESTHYSYYQELSTGYTKDIYADILVPVNYGSGNKLETQFLHVMSEEQRIQWTDDPMRHGQKIQAWMTLSVNGICYISDENEQFAIGNSKVTQKVRRLYPALDLVASGRVTKDMGMTSVLQRIRTEKESLNRIRGNQFNVKRLEINELTNTMQASFSDTRTGSTNTDPYETRSRNVLFKDDDSIAAIGFRIPVSVNAYELPRDRAFELARRVLARLQTPAIRLPVDLPGVDFAIQRGSIVRGQKRTGYTAKFMVSGYGINGTNLGTDGHRIYQTLETLELLTD